ncbi:MAG: hypothetical protein ACRDNZ_24435 [Streptosporangiaceae bacterium]
MPTDLAQWNERLSRHFAELRQVRRRAEDLPLFALEHGLNQAEILDLSEGIRRHILNGGPLRAHSLAWIVYAAEIGYRYSGDEYWQTFDASTPGWALRGDHYWVRARFREFHKEFGGAEPTGAWAEHFTIICWPITHAILPRDLQQQLARILYELRHSFSKELLEAPTSLGEAVAARSWNATARFQKLAQETALVGQIAAALLLQGNVGTDTLIHRATLQRIGQDVERERLGREWLKDARRFAQERARIRGLVVASSRQTAMPRKPAEARAEAMALGIEPRLVLRPANNFRGSWELSLEIPDLSHLLHRFPATQSVLSNSRCVVAGAAGRPLARGRCLHGPQHVALSRWPRADEVLLKFEPSHPLLEFLLRTDCLLRPTSPWLFKIASDGLAYEMRGLRARAGGRYVLVSLGDAPMSGAHVRPITLNCQGVVGALLELPDALTPEWEAELRRLGVTQAKSIEVWPAGLAAAVWDGEGYGEWLASEQPCLAIGCDHSVAQLVVSLTHEAPLQISDVRPGEPIFIELPKLAVGLHKVSFAARGAEGVTAEAIGDLDVLMRVREARPWSSGISPHGPLSVDVDPPAPTLEQFWEGQVEISVRGPPGRPIKCRVSMLTSASDFPAFMRVLPPLNLPADSDQWQRHFDKHLRESKDCQRVYDEARRCDLEFSAEEFGGFTLACEREFKPLRWAIRRSGDGQVAKLYEDVGTEDMPIVSRILFEKPCVIEPLESKREYSAPTTGGLYLARLHEFSAAIILGPIVHTFGDLEFNPTITNTDRSVPAILRMVECSSVWAAARLPGDIFSAQRRRKVLRALASHLSYVIAEGGWADAERAAATGTSEGLITLRRAISKNREAAEIGSALSVELVVLSKMARDARADRFAALARLFLQLSPPDHRWISELALRLASHPMGVEAWAGDRLTEGITKLLERPTLIRAARFLVISTDRQLDSSISGNEIYASWSWK